MVCDIVVCRCIRLLLFSSVLCFYGIPFCFCAPIQLRTLYGQRRCGYATGDSDEAAVKPCPCHNFGVELYQLKNNSLQVFRRDVSCFSTTPMCTLLFCLLRVVAVATVFCTCIVAVHSASPHTELQRDVVALVQKEHPEFRQAVQFAVVVMSLNNCVGCAMAAVNNATTSLHSFNTEIPCAVVVIAEDADDAWTLRKKIAAPYVVADTGHEHVRYAALSGAALPVLIAVSEGTMQLHKDLQHTPPDFRQLFAVSAQFNKGIQLATAADVAVSEQKVLFPTALEVPKGRSLKYLLSPVLTASREKLYGINYLTNSIEVWDATTGAVQEPIAAPDTLKYFFRTDERDTLWTLTESQGYDPARFVALHAIDDTVYALVMVLAGYEYERSTGGSTPNSDSTTNAVLWSTQQVIAKIHDRTVTAIIPLPEKYSFVELLVDRSGTFGGTCLEATEKRSQRDSLAVIALSKPRGGWRLWKTTATKKPTLGSAALSPEGTIWYCDPQRPAFFVAKPGTPPVAVPIQKQLVNAGTPLLLEASPDMNNAVLPFPYVLESMKAYGDKVLLLLSPTDSLSGAERVVQAYKDDGSFIGEFPVRIDSTAVWLVGAGDNAALVLVEKGKRWQLTTVPLTAQE